ncbi:MAG: ribosome biogenesis/translation initiation ATPase RLI [Methanophagales archaeon]|nr:ribosome biogenesis/translation initiation ATPase RLI [Methanophagales archaeon]
MRIAILKKDKCQPRKCASECIKYCPMVQTGAETVVVGSDGKPVISEDLCEGCGICIKKCPFSAISIIGLPEELKGEEAHRYGENGFVLYGMPIPRAGRITGLLGENGIGKSTAITILAGLQVPNLGNVTAEVSWYEIIKRYSGSELQNYFDKLSKGKIRVAYKPQYVDAIPKFFEGTTYELLERTDETGESKRLIKAFELEEAMKTDIKALSGGELQRVAVIACMIRDADFYFLDEITPYLDIYQRVQVAKGIRKVLEEKAVVVVEHDLAILDMLADYVHLLYGEPGGYGVVTLPKSTNRGINEYLSGFLHAENVRIRDKPIEFSAHPPRERQEERTVFIEYDGFEKRYGEDGFLLEAKPGSIGLGEVVGIVGRNATGKSTFVKVLAGETEPTAGSISFDITLSYKPQYIKPLQGLGGRGAEPHNGELDMKVKDFIYSLKEGGLTEADVIEVLNPLGIPEIEEKSLKELSGGELQSVAIAACLCQDASLYMLDEPSAHLDVEQKVRLIKTLRRYAERREVSMMIVDHDIYLIDLLSDRLMVFNGEPGVRGEIKGSFEMREGMNLFLKELGVTFRRDESTLRPRINKIGSAKDREQKEKGQYYYL